MTNKDNNVTEVVTEEEVQSVDTEVVEESQDTSEPSFLSKVGGVFASFGSTIGRWTSRLFYGPNKELSDKDKFDVEKIESPGTMMVKAFLGRRLAMAALIVLALMFLFVFIGPLVIAYDELYMDNNISNMSPTYSMRDYDSELETQYQYLDSYASFTVGLTDDGQVSLWGSTNLGTSGIDMADIPEEVLNSTIIYVAAGIDHAIAIDEFGNVYGWGKYSNGQWGTGSQMPTWLDPDNISSIECGYQSTCVVHKDGTVTIWGNSNGIPSLYKSTVTNATGVKEAFFMGSALLLWCEDGTFVCTSNAIIDAVNGDINIDATKYMEGRDILDVAVTSGAVAIILDNGDGTTELFTTGTSTYGENVVPTLNDGEYFETVVGGDRFFATITSQGRLITWGDNNYGQLKSPTKYNGEESLEIVLGAAQGYIIIDGNVVDSWGLRGFLFGTDNYGRDVFARIVYGGKMTMTIGAVAVIVSSIIAILVGCTSGYFGGWVDMLLMRVTEIFSALPFLPFAMMLSIILAESGLSENVRIFMIMVILGLLSWTGLAQMIRGQVLAEREKEFVTAAKAMGVKEGRIAFKHILPNVMSVVLVSMTLSFATCLLTESSLSYLGFGVSEPTPTWGNMLTGCNNSLVIQNYWWRWVFPAGFLACATICINIVGDTLRDVFDPRSSAER